MAAAQRTFVGLRVGAAVAARLFAQAKVLGGVSPSLRLVAAADLHLTLHFLGPTAPGDLLAMAQALRRVAAGHAPLAVRYRGLGAFPCASRARVVWAGLEALEGDSLARWAGLAGQVGRALAPFGRPPETRPFHPHVTLGRLNARPTEALRAALCGPPESYGEEILSELKLIVSQPGRRPYHYIDLTTVPLGPIGTRPEAQGSVDGDEA